MKEMERNTDIEYSDLASINACFLRAMTIMCTICNGTNRYSIVHSIQHVALTLT